MRLSKLNWLVRGDTPGEVAYWGSYSDLLFLDFKMFSFNSLMTIVILERLEEKGREKSKGGKEEFNLQT